MHAGGNLDNAGPIRGFVLQPSYRIRRGKPVVHLYGRLESGECFQLLDDRPVPHFYVGRADGEHAKRLGAGCEPSEFITMDGRELLRVNIPTPRDTPPLRDRLVEAGIECFEADVRFSMRYLIDRNIRGSIEIEGASETVAGVGRVFRNPTVRPAAWTPELSIVSIDIETDPRARDVLSVAVVGCGVEKVLLLSKEHQATPDDALPVLSQAELLLELGRLIRRLDPDVITGWNVADFDFPVLMRRAEELNVELDLGRVRGGIRRLPGRHIRQATQISIPGRLVLDGLALLRGAAVRMDSFSLDAVAREVLGKGKSLSGDNRAQTILDWYRRDRQKLVHYNLLDAQLVLEILEELRLVELAIERSRLTGMPLDRVSSSIAAFDFLYLSRLYRRGIVAPSVKERDASPQAGGHLLSPQPGLHNNVLVFDFKSLYPSVIRTFQIDPLGFVPEPEPGDDLVTAPNGASFRREPGILTELLDELLPAREAAQKAGNRVASDAIKISMNSFYGVLGTSLCRFYEPRLAEAITGFGKEMLLWSKAFFEREGLEVLYGDTDSVFVRVGIEQPEEALEQGKRLVVRHNQTLSEHVEQTWGVESQLELELERLFLRLYLPPIRHAKQEGATGAAKRYAGLAHSDGKPKLVFVGLESVRRDWTELARRAQRELFERLFFERPVEGYLKALVEGLREGGHDDQLVYRKGLLRDLDSYTSTTPPHVAAARKSKRKPRRVVRYVMTAAGPELADEQTHPLDYQHYVDKQLRPIAEPILALLDLEFDKVVGDDTQMDLFG